MSTAQCCPCDVLRGAACADGAPRAPHSAMSCHLCCCCCCLCCCCCCFLLLPQVNLVGAGLLLGSALCIILPEGFEAALQVCVCCTCACGVWWCTHGP
jgi:hypothetical protein